MKISTAVEDRKRALMHLVATKFREGIDIKETTIATKTGKEFRRTYLTGNGINKILEYMDIEYKLSHNVSTVHAGNGDPMAIITVTIEATIDGKKYQSVAGSTTLLPFDRFHSALSAAVTRAKRQLIASTLGLSTDGLDALVAYAIKHKDKYKDMQPSPSIEPPVETVAASEEPIEELDYDDF